MSAFGGRADIIQGVAECPLIARSGHLPCTENRSFPYRLRTARRDLLVGDGKQRQQGQTNQRGDDLGGEDAGGGERLV